MTIVNLEAKESFKPLTHYAPNSLMTKCFFIGRFVFDFQFNTIYRFLSKEISQQEGNILDVGCGNSPFKKILSPNAKYFGIDVKDAVHFNYNNSDITIFDGENIPYGDDYFDVIICTEVIEHVVNPKVLISEIKRVLKKDGKAVITLPWSARFHYKPYDYHRYTPSMLKILFSEFSSADIYSRGTDYSVIGNKLIVLYISLLKSFFKPSILNIVMNFIKVPFAFILLPVVAFWILLSHLSFLFNFGSADDPLGYSIVLKK